MDPRERLAELAGGRGVSLAALSRMIGRNSSYLQQYITKGSPRKLEEEDRRRLAEFFAVAEAELGAPEEKSLKDRGEWVEVPRLSLEASAGPGATAAEEIPFDAFRFSRRWLREHVMRMHCAQHPARRRFCERVRVFRRSYREGLASLS